MRERRPRTERARNGYQVPREVPVRLNTGTLESMFTRRLTDVEARVCIEMMDFDRDLGLVAVAGGYAITRGSRDVVGMFPTLRAVRAWAYGRRMAGIAG